RAAPGGRGGGSPPGGGPPPPPRPAPPQPPRRGLEPPAGRGHVLAEEHDRLVAPHLLRDAPGDRLPVGNRGHRASPAGRRAGGGPAGPALRQAQPPSCHTLVKASSKSGSGPAFASSVARSTASSASASIWSRTSSSRPREISTPR